jgi:hypothetical protein
MTIASIHMFAPSAHQTRGLPMEIIVNPGP